MHIYLDNGYLDYTDIFADNGIWLWVIIGGRAIGKTYGALKYSSEEHIPIMYMRRTQSQADLAGHPLFTPYKKLCADTGRVIDVRPVTKYNSRIIEIIDGEEVQLGYTCALSTIANIRGFDASDVQALIYDEFIPEPHERPIKEEAAALFNAIETIGRNRELEGRPPLKVILLSNSNDIQSPILLDLGIIKRVEAMQKKHVEVFIDKKRGLGILLPDNSKISEAKRETALYKVAGGSYAEMALDNAFGNAEFSRTESKPLGAYAPIVTLDNVTLYKHKAKREYYVSMHCAGTPQAVFAGGHMEAQRARVQFPWIMPAYINKRLIFEDHLTEIHFRRFMSA